MLELISIGVSCLVLVVVPNSQKYNDEVYDAKLGYPYQYFKGEVLRYRYRLMYLYLMFSLSVSQAVVPYASSVMLPPPTGVTNIERIIDYEIRQGNNLENDQNSGKIIVQPGSVKILEVDNSSIVYQDDELDFLESTTEDIILAKELYQYKYPFQINEYFLTWKNIYQFQIRSQIITITATDSLKKEFYIQEFLKRFNVPNKKKTQLKQMLIEAIYQLVNNHLIQPQFKIIQKDGSIKKINKLQIQDISQIKLIYFYENVYYKSLF